MLISITLTLVSDQEVLLPPHLGRANYAAALARLREHDPALAESLHTGDGPKPITCSGLLDGRPVRDRTALGAGEPARVRITGLSPRLSTALEAALLDTPPLLWTLDDHPFRVAAAVCDPAQDPWSGRTSYEALALRQLTEGERGERRVTLHFASPTAFKSKEMTMPIPLPGLVFGSLVERWNAFSPVTLSPEMRRFGEERIAVSAYHLRSRPVTQKNAALRIGGVGEVTYTALGGDRYWLGVMGMLADFAFYSGVGVQTTTGMGQCRRIG